MITAAPLIRIIPARAGFTRLCRALDGVHGGSSPLARGLLGQPSPRGDGRWIIPARAGFTLLASPGRATAPDHPRSRGVYEHDGRGRVRGEGSSPLARGLLILGLRPVDAERIIPARAGFTDVLRARASRAEDHPRSRGVYPSLSIRVFEERGSSPLARGLLRSRTRPGSAPPDHPRSRGVYGWFSGLPIASLGSSPLARGLPLDEARKRAIIGIIPARAGFTSRDGGRGSASRDHPRSRGVYCRPVRTIQILIGSSPLARGLPLDEARKRAIIGIIPARAGFTRALGDQPVEPADHPRSRGVYLYAAARRSSE